MANCIRLEGGGCRRDHVRGLGPTPQRPVRHDRRCNDRSGPSGAAEQPFREAARQPGPEGWHSIHVNKQWRLVFQWDGGRGEAASVYVDDHRQKVKQDGKGTAHVDDQAQAGNGR